MRSACTKIGSSSINGRKAAPQLRQFSIHSPTPFRLPSRTVSKSFKASLLPSRWQQMRGAKRTVPVTLKDLPQGVLGGEAIPQDEEPEPDLPPLLLQVRNNMLKFSHCVLLTRVGGFYEVRVPLTGRFRLMLPAVFRACRRVCTAFKYQEDFTEDLTW